MPYSLDLKYNGNKKIAVLHDYLYSLGGAEKVLESILDLLPQAELFTSFYDKSFPSEIIKKKYKDGQLHTSILDRLPKNKFLEKIYRKLSFLVFRRWDFSKYDVLVINSSGPATWVKKSNDQKIISYYHKIPSFEFLGLKDIEKQNSPELVEKAMDNGELMLGSARRSFSILDRYFKSHNRKYIDQIDILISNSIHYSKNFRILYGKSPKIVNPPIDENHLKDILKFKKPDYSSDYYVYLGRLEPYKGIEFIVDACIKMNKKLKVIGNGSLKDKLPKHQLIEYLGFVSESSKYEILANARALINGSREDFGIVYLDALCSGTPIIAFGEGGVSEIAKEAENAIFFTSQDSSSLMDALDRFEKSNIKISESERLDIISRYGKARFKKEILDIIEGI
ncbi:MAG: glycosyltransferase [bacterium]